MSAEELILAIKLKDAIPRKSDYLYKEENILLAKRKLFEEMIRDGADLELCCPEDAVAIREYPEWDKFELFLRNLAENTALDDYIDSRGS